MYKSEYNDHDRTVTETNISDDTQDSTQMNPYIGISSTTMDMMITGGNTQRKQITIDASVYNTIKTLANEFNGKISQGTFIYEIMMFANTDTYEDDQTHYEELMDEKLASELSRSKVQTIDTYTNTTVKEARAYMRAQTPEDVQATDSISDFRIHLPEQLLDQLEFTRGWNSRIKDALIQYIQSPFNSRMDRVRTKRTIYEHITTGTQLSIQEADIYEHITETEDNEITSLKEYKENADTLTGWAERKETMSNVVKENKLTRTTVNKIWKQAHGITTESYLNKYINEMWEEYDLDYHIYDRFEQITKEMNNPTAFNKQHIDKISINDLFDALKVIDILVDTHDEIELMFIHKHIESQINHTIEFNKHPQLTLTEDNTITRI